MSTVRTANFFRSFDWWTLLLYLILVMAGWFTIHAASYTLDGASIFDFDRPSGKQIVWFGLASILVLIILLIDVKFYMIYPPVIYPIMIVALVATIFFGTDINGSRSWIKLGSFSIQPAEFGKFSTSLMLAWLFNTYNFRLDSFGNYLKTILIVLLPVVLIILQKETGSALVYFSMIFLFYRQGMSGVVLWSAFCFILIFVLGIKYSVDLETDQSILLGQNIVLTIIPFLVAAMLWVYAHHRKAAGLLALVAGGSYLLTWLVMRYIPLPFHFEYRWVGLAVCCFAILQSLWLYLMQRVSRYLLIAVFSIGFLGFLYTADFAFNKLQPHQRQRIEVLLGMREDLHGVGYNVNQAKIAIGSGGLTGKGYLSGTQTVLAYVPEQETDFIFCTVGEEFGFLGSTLLIILYATFILRLIYLAERQHTIFAQVYGYCVASIFAFHVLINIGMDIGLVPVIGIPLPFFSYGGSSLWSFTILLFIFLKLDAYRGEKF